MPRLRLATTSTSSFSSCATGTAGSHADPLLCRLERFHRRGFHHAVCDHPDTPEEIIAGTLRRSSDTAVPNELFVALADEELGREGRMSAALAGMGPNRIATECMRPPSLRCSQRGHAPRGVTPKAGCASPPPQQRRPRMCAEFVRHGSPYCASIAAFAVLIAATCSVSAQTAYDEPKIEGLLKSGWQIAGIPARSITGRPWCVPTSGSDILVQCRTGYDATREPHIEPHCYKLR